MLGPIFSGEILAAFLKSMIVRLHGRANGNFHHEVLIFVFSWDSALLAPRWWLRIIPKGCSHMISRFATPTFFLMRLSFLKDFSSSHLAPFQDMISRTGHEWLRLPGRKGLLAKLVTRQEFRAETEDGEGAMCWGKCIHLEAVRKPGSTVGFLGQWAVSKLALRKTFITSCFVIWSHLLSQ